jgi:hypothetical protein
MKKDTEENIQEQSTQQSEKKLEEQRIAFSADLVSCLEEKKKAFNKKNKANIKIDQLKEVYKRGAATCDEDSNLNGLARVNMFLRMKEQKTMGVVSAKLAEKEELSELILESENLQNSNKPLDISEAWVPQDEDIDYAKADIEQHKLHFNFKNIDELYLEPYKPIQFNWE